MTSFYAVSALSFCAAITRPNMNGLSYHGVKFGSGAFPIPANKLAHVRQASSNIIKEKPILDMRGRDSTFELH